MSSDGRLGGAKPEVIGGQVRRCCAGCAMQAPEDAADGTRWERATFGGCV